jgi:hypothetical protein
MPTQEGVDLILKSLALAGGAVGFITGLSHYRKDEYHLVSISDLVQGSDRDQVVTFAKWCLGSDHNMLVVWTLVDGILKLNNF